MSAVPAPAPAPTPSSASSAASSASSSASSAQSNSAASGSASGAASNSSGNAASSAGPQGTQAANAPGQPGQTGDANNPTADAGLFARLLGAQIGNMGAAPSTLAGTAATSDKPGSGSLGATGKPAKTASQATTQPLDLSLLQSQTMAAMMPAPAAQTAANANASNGPASGTIGELAGAGGATVAGTLAANDDNAADGALGAMGADGKNGTARQSGNLQNLPQQGPVQPTFLPQASAQGTSASEKASAAPTFNVDQQVGTPAWSKAISDQVMTMVSLKAETAHIQVSPPQLGPIEVTLRMDAHNNAQVTFTADSAATRAALQDSLPRLHTLMAAGGIQLGDAQVSSGQQGAQQQFQSSRSSAQAALTGQTESEEPDTLDAIKAARGVLSIFA
jgi:flagellar hook-length control protein FliK